MAESPDNCAPGLTSLPPVPQVHGQGRDGQRDAGREDEERASSMFALTNKVSRSRRRRRRRNLSDDFDLFLQCVAGR